MICLFGFNLGTAFLAYFYSLIGRKVYLYVSKDVIGDVYSLDLLHLWSLGLLENRGMAKVFTYDYLVDVLGVRVVEVADVANVIEPSECSTSYSSYEIDPEHLNKLLGLGGKPVEVKEWPGLTLERALAIGRLAGKVQLFDEDVVRTLGVERVEGDAIELSPRVPRVGVRIGVRKIDGISGVEQAYARDLVLVRDAYRAFIGRPPVRDLVVDYAIGKDKVVASLGGSKSSMPKSIASKAHFSRTSFGHAVCKVGIVGGRIASLQYVGPVESISLIMAVATMLEEGLDLLVPSVVEHPRLRSVISTPIMSLLVKYHSVRGSGPKY